MPDDSRGTDSVRMTARVDGRVQGVGFRWFVYHAARNLGLVGRATNCVDGTVEVVAEGPREQCEHLVDTLRGPRTPGHVTHVSVQWTRPTGLYGFSVE